MSLFYLTDKVKIYPDSIALNKLWHVSYLCKDIWNHFNEDRRNNRTNFYEQKRELPKLKKANPEYKIPSSQVLQEVVKLLNSGWRMFFTKHKNGDTNVKPPRFKSYKYFFTQKYNQRGTSFEIKDHVLRLAYGKNLNDWIEIDLPELNYNADNIKNVTIFYDEVQNNWYVSLIRQVELPHQKNASHTIYFDPGCKMTLTGIKTDHSVWEYDINPLRELNLKHYQLIDYLKSKRDKKKKGSKRWRKLNKSIKNVYRKISTQTKQYLHKIANQILEDHPDCNFQIGNWHKQKTLADTGIKFVDKRINRQVLNNNPVKRLVGYLQYKALLKGQQVDEFNERGTTSTCSCCGEKQKMPPGKRVFNCMVCSFKTERDINSTLNFLKKFSYASWQSLSSKLSIARCGFNPTSGENRRFENRTVILNY